MVARAWAWLDSRDYVTPDDLQALAIPVWQHRFVMKAVEVGGRTGAASCVKRLFEELSPPC